jgi:phosphate starvation-inducible PhoH-like protein
MEKELSRRPMGKISVKPRGCETTVRNIELEDGSAIKGLMGPHDINIKTIEDVLGVTINARGNTLKITGDEVDVDLSIRVIKDLYNIIKKGYPIYPQDVGHAIRILSSNSKLSLEEIFLDTVYISTKKKIITPKSLNQKEYVDAIRKYDIVVAIGPAGTGKTYLAMAMAISYLIKKEFSRIILTRPAVEAGERLGFLPGDLYEKVNPYLRPLYDALHDMMDLERASSMIQKGEIEVAPLAFMRGRTLNDSFVILDEAQNTTSEQMKMFLTRLGFGSKVVITGDITQIDLPQGKTSGLIEINHILKEVKGIRFIYFSEEDVFRHPLVQKIIKAYERVERKEQGS